MLQAPIIEIDAPPRADAEGWVTLAGAVRDDQDLRDVQIFLNGRKVAYRRSPGRIRSRLPFRVKEQAAPGRNRLRVVARDTEGLFGERALLVWRGAPSGFPITGLREER